MNHVWYPCTTLARKDGLKEKPAFITNPYEYQPCCWSDPSPERLNGCRRNFLTPAHRRQGPHVCPTQTSHLATWALLIPTLPTFSCLRGKRSCPGQGFRVKALFPGWVFSDGGSQTAQPPSASACLTEARKWSESTEEHIFISG